VGSRAPGTARLKIKISVPLSPNHFSLRETSAENFFNEELSNQLRPAKRANA